MPHRKRSADWSPSASAPDEPPSRFLLTFAAVLLVVWIVVLTVLALAA
ncbi:MAG: hypothetical protein WDZ59_10530 [Pirellulales bacterium]